MFSLAFLLSHWFVLLFIRLGARREAESASMLGLEAPPPSAVCKTNSRWGGGAEGAGFRLEGSVPLVRRRGSNEQHERLLVAAARGGPGALSGSGSGGPAARAAAAAAAARGGSGRRAAETMVSAGRRGEQARGSPGRRLHLWLWEWVVSRSRAGAPAGAGLRLGGRAGRGRHKQGRVQQRPEEDPPPPGQCGVSGPAYVMPLLRIGGVLTLPTGTARSVRGLHRLEAVTGLCPHFFKGNGLFTGLHLKVFFILQFGSSGKRIFRNESE